MENIEKSGDFYPIIPESEEQQTPNKFNSVLGITLAFASGLIFTANNCLIQTYKLDFSDALLVRSLVQIFLLGLICKYKGLSLWPKVAEKLRMIMVLQGNYKRPQNSLFESFQRFVEEI